MNKSKKDLLYLSLANFIFLVHASLVFLVSLGWLFKSIFSIFLIFWVLTFVSELVYNRCLLTNLEFDLRRKVYPESKYEKSFIVHYYRKLFGLDIRENLDNKNKTMLQKNIFKIILVVLLVLAKIYNCYL